MTPDEIETLPLSDMQARLPKLQFYMVFMRPVDPSADPRPMLAQHGRPHLLFLHDLERRGILLASGPQRAEEGHWDGTGVAVLRADSLAAARAIAEQEPLHVAGLRRNEVLGWQISEASFTFTLRLLDGTFDMR